MAVGQTFSSLIQRSMQHLTYFSGPHVPKEMLYPVVLSCLCSRTLLGGAKQLQWCGETDQRTIHSCSLWTRLQHGPLGRFLERTYLT